MAIESNCSGCGQRLTVDDAHAGKRARCPACGQIYTIAYPHQAADSNPENAVQPQVWGPTTGDHPQSEAADREDQFWMLAPDGSQYGPVDRPTLSRWYQEGRVGRDYKIRQSLAGPWQAADYFRPTSSSNFAAGHTQTPQGFAGRSPAASPYTSSATVAPAYGGQSAAGGYAQSDRSGLVLAMGILSFFVCPIFGIVAWIMGGSALRGIAAGTYDPVNKGLIQVGYYLGIASVLLNFVCIGGFILLSILSAIS